MRALHVVVVCLLLTGVALAKSKGEMWYEKGGQAYSEKNWAQAAECYEKALKAFGPKINPDYEAGVAYNLACCYALKGDADKAFAAIERAVRAGYTDWRWLERDADFASLRNNYAERFTAAVRKCQTAATEERLTKSPIAVISYDGYRGCADLSGWAWDDPHGKDLTAFRTKYRLDSVAATGTEWERMKRLLNWTSTRWEHDGNHGCASWNPSDILDAAAKGERFACIQYAIVLINVLNAMGYPSRLVGLMGEGTAWGNGRGHSAVEVWSNNFQKWILLDGQNNAWWQVKGVPQSGAECRRYYLADQEDSLDFVGQDSRKPYDRLKHQWAIYFYHVAAQQNEVFFPQTDTPKVSNVRYVLDGNGTLPELFHQSMPYADRPIDDEAFLYPPLNQVRINILHTNWKQPSDTVHVKLEHNSPFFERFLVRMNGGEWQKTDAEFNWPLAPGQNQLEAKAVSFGGVESKAATIVLRNNLRKAA